MTDRTLRKRVAECLASIDHCYYCANSEDTDILERSMYKALRSGEILAIETLTKGKVKMDENGFHYIILNGRRVVGNLLAQRK